MKRVVMVDDSKTVHLSAQKMLQEIVSSGEIELLTYENPLELLDECKKGLIYDLLITDINMPEMNGLELARELKSLPHLALKPIVALTTENGEDKKLNAKEIGLAGWITKPFMADKLVMAIKRLLKLR